MAKAAAKPRAARKPATAKATTETTADPAAKAEGDPDDVTPAPKRRTTRKTAPAEPA